MKILKTLAILVFVVAVFTVVASAVETKRTATISEIQGTVDVKPAQGKWLTARVGMVLNQGDMVRTKAKSSAILDLDGNAKTAKVEMKENSQLSLAKLMENKAENAQTTMLELSIGKILINVKKLETTKSKFEVTTPTSIVGVRGTTFSVAVEAIE